MVVFELRSISELVKINLIEKQNEDDIVIQQS